MNIRILRHRLLQWLADHESYICALCSRLGFVKDAKTVYPLSLNHPSVRICKVCYEREFHLTTYHQTSQGRWP